MYISHNIRILHSADSTLEELVKTGQLSPVPGQKIRGASGTVYRPSVAISTDEIVAESDTEFRIGSTSFAANCHALPPEEYSGMVTLSPGYRQYLGLRSLVQLLTEHLDGDQTSEWKRELYTAIAAGSRPLDGRPPVLLPPSVTRSATWLREETRLVHGQCGWFLVLVFDLPERPVTHTIRRSAVGIDVGLRRLAVASFRSGCVSQARGIPDIRLEQTELEQYFPNDPTRQNAARTANLIAQRAAARAELWHLTEHLLDAASVVAVEDLDYGKRCDEVFIRRSRELGIRDFLGVWLPSRLKQNSITMIRVPPEMTSQICNMTHLKGNRSNTDVTRFEDGNGTTRDADENAASNIRDAGLAMTMWGKR